MDIIQEHINLLRAQFDILQRMHGPVRRYRAGRKCVKGYNCGGSCITRKKNCRKALEGEAKNFSEWMVLKMSANISDIVGESPPDRDPIANIDVNDYKSVIEGGRAFTADLSFDEDLSISNRAKQEFQDASTRLYDADTKLRELYFGGQKDTPEFEEAKQEVQRAAEDYKRKRLIAENPPTPQADAFKQKLIDHHKSKGYSRDQAMSAAANTKTERFRFGGKNSKVLGKQAMKEYQSSAADVFEMSGGKAANQIDYVVRSGDRAWAIGREESGIGKGFVNVANGSKESIYHEVAHHIEYENPAIAKTSQDFVKSKASGPPQKIKDLTGENYRDDEIAYPDEFVHPYVGKITGKASSEVISTGVERLANGKAMREFREKDPEHFNYVIGVLLS